ncbi:MULTISPECIES: hypothetical protein [unclassified Streptomyces]|uniref:hypothetical protein n=1 Tax=unclassified Streptomyces TaxID=2593676 RepID=UPI003327EEA9
MNASVTSLAARRRSTTVEDVITSQHAGLIADYLTAYLNGDTTTMTVVRDFASQMDADYPGYPSLVAQLDALRSQAAA